VLSGSERGCIAKSGRGNGYSSRPAAGAVCGWRLV
jgi:hypothetical protein